MSESATPIADSITSSISSGSIYLATAREIEEYPELLPYAHYLRQAWTELDLTGILCVDGRPKVYVCEKVQFTSKQIAELQRFVWNQGIVPLLIVGAANRVEVHSTIKIPVKDQHFGNLFSETASTAIPYLDNIADALQMARFVRSVETGQFFHDYANFFPPDETVDRCLLRNLVSTARRLKATGWTLSQAHALLGRVLFVSFLHARNFITSDFFPVGTASLLDILSQPTSDDTKRLLYGNFFARLKQEFNGTMFDSALDEEEGRIRKENFDAVAHFLGHHDAESGQLEIGFWAYDFRYIPVEIISAIYDEFMKEADMSRKRAEGAYYTPRLLAETTLHIALEGRYNDAFGWRILDPACGSGIFLVAMFNLLAEQWRRANINSSLEAKAQALLGILQNQIRGIDVNPEACRITAFSLYLALFEKLHPTDVENFKRNISSGPFLPALHWSQSNQIEYPVVIEGDFIKDDLPIKCDFDLIIGNPPWESRGREQIALTFTTQSTKFMNETGVGCFLLPTPILVSRTGTLDANWFRTVSVEKIVQLADFRRFLFEATHSCFILRFSAIQPKLEQIIAYETPKINRFDRRQGIIIVEPDDQKAITLRQVLEAARNNRLQSLWSRKFWGTPRDEGFLRRLDLYPQLSDVVSERSWSDGGVGFMPFYPGISKGRPVPLEPWKLTDKYLENDNQFPQLLVEGNDLISLEEGLRNSIYKRNGKHIPASLSDLRRRSADYMFEPPMVIFSQGFTKFAFSAHRTLFQNSLRSINGPKEDADLLCFLTAVLSSRLIQYYAFHSSSSNSIGRAQVHVYEILAIPFPLPHHDLAPDNAKTIIEDVVSIFKRLGENGLRGTERNNAVRVARKDINILVGKYYSISDAEEMLIDDTLELSRPSIHQSNLDADIPTLAMPSSKDRKVYADTLCLALNRMSRKQGIQASARGMVSERLNLMMVTLVFGNGHSPYQEISGDEALWDNLSRIDKTARRRNGSFSYLRGFSYFEADRLHTLKPATMRNWSRTAALNDADAIFEQLIGKSA